MSKQHADESWAVVGVPELPKHQPRYRNAAFHSLRPRVCAYERTTPTQRRFCGRGRPLEKVESSRRGPLQALAGRATAPLDRGWGRGQSGGAEEDRRPGACICRSLALLIVGRRTCGQRLGGPRYGVGKLTLQHADAARRPIVFPASPPGPSLVGRPYLGAGWAVPLRRPGAGSSSSTGSTPSTSTPPYELYPDPKKALELLVGRCLADGPPGFQRGPPRHDVERARARDGRGQRSGHLRARAPRGTRTSSTKPSSTGTSPTSLKTVDLLGRFHIYTILDMHQDVFNEMFEGRVHRWAVCTNDVPERRPARTLVPRCTARWAAGIAFSHFWHNNVRRRSAGPVRPRSGKTWRTPSGGQPLGPRLRPVQRTVLDVADPLW